MANNIPENRASLPQVNIEAPLRPEREKTDHSLQTERHTADETTEKVRISEEHADRIVDLARARADGILTDAREKADGSQYKWRPAGAVALDRKQADELLRKERAAADESIRLERDNYARALRSLLPLEREHTNRNLLTERARSDAALSYRDDFLGMVSHDLNNLLAGIVMTLDSISITTEKTRTKAETEEEKRIDGEKRIKLYVARMRRLVSDLVDVTSITGGKLRVSPEPSDARNLIAETLETFRLLAAQKDISLKSGITSPPLLAEADQGRIMQVLMNLMANAIKFAPRGGHIFINAEESGDSVLFSVKDDGPGIPESLHESMFERFWQVNKNDNRGIGLGLYIARNIVTAHGGKIWAESRLGEGSTFYFTLPKAGMNHLRSGTA